MSGISHISGAGGGAYNAYFHPAMNRVNTPQRANPLTPTPMKRLSPVPAMPESNNTATGWAINSFKSILNFFSQPTDNQSKNNVSEIQTQCLTCCNREYTCSNGETSDGKKAIIPGHESAERVRQHEAEHLRIARAEAKAQGKLVVAQQINMIAEKCPECGESYVAKGEAVTKTVEVITTGLSESTASDKDGWASSRHRVNGPNMRLEGIGRLFDGYG